MAGPLSAPGLLRVTVPDGVPPDVVAAAERVGAILPWPSSASEVLDTSWSDAWKASAEVVEVEGVVVVPAWKTAVTIDPGTAFGSGSHPSTRLCLAALVALAPSRRVLDVGCGSGVLAVTAMRLGATAAVAIDVATEAVAASMATALASRVGEGGTLVLAGLLDDQVPDVVATYGREHVRLDGVESLDGWACVRLTRR